MRSIEWCAASWVQLSVSAGDGWPHNALQHHWLMAISCHFRYCKALLVTSLTHASGAITSVQTYTFTFYFTSYNDKQVGSCMVYRIRNVRLSNLLVSSCSSMIADNTSLSSSISVCCITVLFSRLKIFMFLIPGLYRYVVFLRCSCASSLVRPVSRHDMCGHCEFLWMWIVYS